MENALTIAYIIFCALALVLPASCLGLTYLSAAVIVSAWPESIPAYRLPGGGTFTLGDGVLLLIFARHAVFGSRRVRDLLRIPSFKAPLVLFLGYFVTTLFGAASYGEQHQMACVISLARATSALLLGYAIAFGLADSKAIRLSSYLLLVFLIINAGIIYFNYGGSRFGLEIGEVQGIERGAPRYFGPIGDCIGFILEFGVFVALLRRNVPLVVFFGGAIILTGTIGAVLSLGVGGALMLIFHRKLIPQFGKGAIARLILWLGLAIAAMGVLALFWGGAATLRQRLEGGGAGAEQSATQRLWSFGLAVDVVRESPLFGVGYQGFADIYGQTAFTGFEEAKGDVANANNQILQVLADGGIVMIGIFGWFMYHMVGAFRRAAYSSTNPGVLAFFAGTVIWLLALIFGNQTAAWFIPGSVLTMLFWVLFGHAMAAIQLEEQARLMPSPHRSAPTFSAATLK